MTRQVALSEVAYAALRRRKAENESFSDAVMRLLEAHDKDPMSFVRRPITMTLSAAEHLRMVDEDRKAWT